MSMRLLDLFAGIGALSLGLERSGFCKAVAHVENEPHAQAVLRRHWPDNPIHGDIETREFVAGEADVICGGFPCPDISCAGKGAGLSGSRSGLYRELVRAVRVVRPQHVIVENVAMLLVRGVGTVLGDLAASGYDLEWDCVPASAVGAPHKRDRIWIIAHANGEGGLQQKGIEPQQRRWASDRAETPITDVANSNSVTANGGRHDSSDVCRQRSEEAVLCRSIGGSENNATESAHTTRIGCGEGWQRRPPDSFARIRDEARRNAADPYGARLAFREGLTRDAWEKLTPAERDCLGNERQSVWPDEPALQGMDDGDPYWMDRIRETGNAVVTLIPQLIGEAMLAAKMETVQES